MPGAAPVATIGILGRRCRTHLTRRILVAALLLGTACGRAERLPEPPTVLYGKVVFRRGNREVVLDRGELTWVLRGTLPRPWEREFRTPLRSMGGGRFSYRLPVPHDLLTLDLTTAPGSVPMMAMASEVSVRSVTLDGVAVSLLAPATSFFPVRQTSRAASVRLDVDASAACEDSDQDALPDRWELEHGLDPWNPADGEAHFSGETQVGGKGDLAAVPGPSIGDSGFAAWRAREFPGASGDLDAFAGADADGDGVPNIVEYAFDLNPRDASDTTGWDRLPQARWHEGRLAVELEQRPGKADLEFRIETSTGLRSWEPTPTDPGNQPSSFATPVPAGRRVVLAGPEPSTAGTARFLRVQVQRRP